MKSKMQVMRDVLIILILLAFLTSVALYAKKVEEIRLLRSTPICEDMGEIESIRYVRGGKLRALVKIDEKWIWEDDPENTVDQRSVNTQLKKPLNVTAMDIEKKNSQDEDYGIERSTFSISITDTNEKTVSIILGKNIEKDTYYAKIDEKETIYIVNHDIKDVILALDSGRFLREQLDAYSSPTRRY